MRCDNNENAITNVIIRIENCIKYINFVVSQHCLDL